MEETGQETSKPGSKSINPNVLVVHWIGRDSDKLINGHADADGWVETGTKFVCAWDNAQEGGNNAYCSSDSFSITSCVLSLDHEDYADEKESADNLVNEGL